MYPQSKTAQVTSTGTSEKRAAQIEGGCRLVYHRVAQLPVDPNKRYISLRCVCVYIHTPTAICTYIMQFYTCINASMYVYSIYNSRCVYIYIYTLCATVYGNVM